MSAGARPGEGEGSARGTRPQQIGGVVGLVRQIRRRLLRRGALAAALWWGSFTCAVLTLAFLLSGPTGWEEGEPLPLLLLGAVLAAALSGVFVFLKARRGALGEAGVVRQIERSRGLPPGVLLGSLELARSGRGAPSPVLAREAERSVLSRAGRADLLAGPLEDRLVRAVRLGSGFFTVGATLVFVLLVLAPDRAVRAWSGLGTSVSLLASPPLPALQVEPGSVDLPRGEGLEVRIGAGPRERVFLHLHRAGDVPSTDTLVVREGASTGRIDDVRAPLEYWVSAPDGDHSPRFRVNPVDPVFLSGLRVEITFPPHTGLLPEEHEGDVPPLAVPAGSRLRVEGRTSRELRSAALADPGGEEEELIPLDVDGREFGGSWDATTSGTYRWMLVDGSGEAVPPEDLPPIELTVVPDSVPDVAILFPARDTILPLSRRQPLMVEARDDFGLRRLEVVARRDAPDGESSEPVVAGIDVEGSRTATLRSVLDVTGWQLSRGDVVRYYARAVDNHPSAQEARTPEYVLRVPGRAELGSEASRRLEEASERVDGLAERARDAEEETRNLARRTREIREPSGSGAQARGRLPRSDEEELLDYATAEDLRQSLDRHEGIVDEVEGLRDELEELARELREAGLPDPELERDLRELRSLLSDLTSPELRERLRDVSSALDERELERVREALRELMEEQTGLREGLEDSLERFRRAAAEQEMRATEEETRELAREERLLAENFEEGMDPEEGASRQEELEERTDRLEERLRQLAERLDALEEGAAAEAARQSAEGAEEARSAMADAVASAEAGEGEQAAAEAGEAAEALESLLEEMERAREEMAEEFRNRLRAALEQVAHDALGLSRRQSELMERMPESGRARRDTALQGEEAALLQGLQNIATNLTVATRMAPDIARQLGPALGAAMESVEETQEALSGGRAAGPPPRRSAAGAQEALNRVALEALRQAEQAGREGPGGAMEALLQELQSLADQQGQLQQETESLLPMELGMEAMMEALQELAQGQGDVAGGLEDLAERPGGERDTLGDLHEMAEEARELSRELEEGRIDAETAARQERLFQRLLDAGRTLERDEEGEEREGTTAEEVERPDVDPLPTELLRGLRFTPPPAGDLEGLSPAQRRLVLEYFERLNRSTSAPPGGGGGP